MSFKSETFTLYKSECELVGIYAVMQLTLAPCPGLFTRINIPLRTAVPAMWSEKAKYNSPISCAYELNSKLIL